MQKIIFPIVLLLFSLSLSAKDLEITKATKLISNKEMNEAYLILNQIIENKKESDSSKMKAIRLLVTYPLGTIAYAQRHIHAKKLIEDQQFFKSLSIDDQLFILRTGGLGAFQAADWNASEIFFKKIISISEKFPTTFLIGQVHHDDLGISVEYIGWIKINQKKIFNAFNYWSKQIDNINFSSTWREMLIRDIGQSVGEITYEMSINDFQINKAGINLFISKIKPNEVIHFKDGLQSGIERSNFEDKKYDLILKRTSELNHLAQLTQERILENNQFAPTRPCFFFEISSSNSFSPSEELKNKVQACWNYIKNSIQTNNDKTLEALKKISKDLELKLITAEINEYKGDFYQACILSIQLDETQMATRTCSLGLKNKSETASSTKMNEEIILALNEKSDQSKWISVWDILFINNSSDQSKIEFLKKYYPTPQVSIELSDLYQENRPLIWWFEYSMSKIASNEQIDTQWSDELLKISSPIWRLLKISPEQKYQAILSISINSQKNDVLLENINEIEKNIKPGSSLEQIYTVWLNQYVNDNKISLLGSKERNSPYYDYWLRSLNHIVSIKNLDPTSLEKWNLSNPKKYRPSPYSIPDIANTLNKSATNFLKINKIKLDLKDNAFAKKIEKSINLLNQSVKSLQIIAQNNSIFSSELEEIRKEYIDRVLIKIEQIQSPMDWKVQDKSLWAIEKEKITNALEGLK